MTEIEALGAAALAQAPNLAGLTYLDLRCAIGPDAARALAASPYLRQLKSLVLHACDIGDEGAKALARSPVLATLEDLDLSYNDLTDEGARALAASPYLERLKQGGLGMETAIASPQTAGRHSGHVLATPLRQFDPNPGLQRPGSMWTNTQRIVSPNGPFRDRPEMGKA